MTLAGMRVGVLGLGLMGSGIAEVCARAGCEVRVVEVNEGALDAGLGRIRGSLDRAVERGKSSREDAAAALARITGGVDLQELSDRELVIEAASENEAVKLELFARLDEIVAPSGILASNTSAIPISRLATATRHPERVIGLHFFNPAPVMELVEIIRGVRTGDDARERAGRFVAGLGKTPVTAPDRAGFIVNALLVPYLLAGIRMMEAGYATADDIDTAMRLGCGHPMGPLQLADLAGLDTVAAAAESLHREFGDAHLAPPPVLLRMVESGMLGRKTGRGFYVYDA